MIDLKTATEQEVFDYVAQHLLTQNKKAQVVKERETYSGNPLMMCVYRAEIPCGPYGSETKVLMCAAGCLLPESVYNEHKDKIEDFDYSSLVINKFMPENHQFLIGDLQQLHDNYCVKEWRDELNNLAKEYELKGIEVAAQ